MISDETKHGDAEGAEVFAEWDVAWGWGTLLVRKGGTVCELGRGF